MPQLDTRPSTAHDLLTDIREHYDTLSLFYRFFWGVHIHHGYWEGDETPETAQVNLIHRLAEQTGICRGARVLDIGCGLGGSYDCDGARWRRDGVDRLPLGRAKSSAPSLAQSRGRLGREPHRHRRRQLHVVDDALRLPR